MEKPVTSTSPSISQNIPEIKPLSTVPERSHSIPLIVAVVVGTALLGVVGFYLGTKKSTVTLRTTAVASPEIAKSTDASLNATPALTDQKDGTNLLSPLPTVAPSVMPGIKSPAPGTFKRSDPSRGFTVSYPSTWRTVNDTTFDGFGPREVGEDVLWGITSYDTSRTTVDQIAEEVGEQFSNRKQTREDITVGGVKAIKFVTTLPDSPSWYSETILFETPKKYFVISNGAMTDDALQKLPGVPQGTTFEQFYSSFTLVK